MCRLCRGLSVGRISNRQSEAVKGSWRRSEALSGSSSI
jgi:hypothetical protein